MESGHFRYRWREVQDPTHLYVVKFTVMLLLLLDVLNISLQSLIAFSHHIHLNATRSLSQDLISIVVQKRYSNDKSPSNFPVSWISTAMIIYGGIRLEYLTNLLVAMYEFIVSFSQFWQRYDFGLRMIYLWNFTGIKSQFPQMTPSFCFRTRIGVS